MTTVKLELTDSQVAALAAQAAAEGVSLEEIFLRAVRTDNPRQLDAEAKCRLLDAHLNVERDAPPVTVAHLTREHIYD
jgi:alpha-D-ribose 1-methylphosphonate 5-triphosphate synthase subunit PhnI